MTYFFKAVDRECAPGQQPLINPLHFATGIRDSSKFQCVSLLKLVTFINPTPLRSGDKRLQQVSVRFAYKVSLAPYASLRG